MRRRGQSSRLQLALSPGAEDEAANREADEWSAHVDKNQRPRICFEGGEHANGRVFNEQEREPADECDFQTSDCVRGIDPGDQPRQRVIDKNSRNKSDHVGGEIMRPLDVGHRPGVKIQPLLAKNGVPAPADEEINHHKDPDGKMIDLVVHRNGTIIMLPQISMAS